MKPNHGFSLLELLIAIVIIAILITIAYPSYNGYLAKGRRTQAMIDLLYMASQLESFYTLQNTYQGAPGLKTTTDDHSYQLVIQSTTDSSYNLTAVPNSTQAALDQSCGTLTLNELGERGDSGTLTPEVCWH